MATTILPEKGKVISQFLEHCDVQTYSTKQLIIREGDLSDSLYSSDNWLYTHLNRSG